MPQQLSQVLDYLLQFLFVCVFHGLLRRACEELLECFNVLQAQVYQLLLHYVVLDIVQQPQVLSDH